MTLEEFRNEFDVLYNNIASNAAPPVDDYEKSVFLTLAQEELVKQLYNGNNELGISFESTEEAREYLSNLIVIKEYTNTSTDNISIFEKELDVMYILREVCTLKESDCNLGEINVVPTTLNDLNRSLNNPFKRPSNNKVLRVNIGDTIKLYSKYPLDKYIITYLKRPNPIILKELEFGLTIQDNEGPSECELNPILHRVILNNAVALAKAAYIGN